MPDHPLPQARKSSSRAAAALAFLATLLAPVIAHAAEEEIALAPGIDSLAKSDIPKAPVFAGISEPPDAIRLVRSTSGAHVLELELQGTRRISRARVELSAAELDTLRACLATNTAWPGTPPWAGATFLRELPVDGDARFGLGVEEARRVPSIAKRYPDVLGARLFESPGDPILEIRVDRDGHRWRFRHRQPADAQAALKADLPPPTSSPGDRPIPTPRERAEIVGLVVVVAAAVVVLALAAAGGGNGCDPGACNGCDPGPGDDCGPLGSCLEEAMIPDADDERSAAGAAALTVGTSAMFGAWLVLLDDRLRFDVLGTTLAIGGAVVAATAIGVGFWASVPRAEAITWAASRATLVTSLARADSPDAGLFGVLGGSLAFVAASAIVRDDAGGTVALAESLGDLGLGAGLWARAAIGSPTLRALAPAAGLLVGVAGGLALGDLGHGWGSFQLAHAGALSGAVFGAGVHRLLLARSTEESFSREFAGAALAGAATGGVLTVLALGDADVSTRESISASVVFATAGLLAFASENPRALALVGGVTTAGTTAFALLQRVGALQGSLAPVPVIKADGTLSPGFGYVARLE